MAGLEGETSNSFFEILSDWEEQLKPFSETISDVSNRGEGFRHSGPKPGPRQ